MNLEKAPLQKLGAKMLIHYFLRTPHKTVFEKKIKKFPYFLFTKSKIYKNVIEKFKFCN